MRRPCPPRASHLDVTTAHDPRPWRVSWTGPGSAEVGDARLQADGVSRGPGWVTVLFDPSDRVEVVVASAPDAGDAPAGEVVPDGRAPRKVVLGQGWSRGQPRRLLARRRRVRGREPLRRPAVVHPQRVRALPLAARARAVLRWRLGHARRVPGARRPAHGARPAGSRARRAPARLPRPERPRRLAAGVRVPPAAARDGAAGLARRRRLLARPRRRRLPAHDRRREPARRDGRLRRRRRPRRAGHGGRAPPACGRPHHGEHGPREPAAGIRPRRLERLAPAGRPAPGRPPRLDVDGGAPDAVAAHPRRGSARGRGTRRRGRPGRRRRRARRAHPRRAARPARRRPGAAGLPAAPRRRALRAARAPERRAHRAALRRAAVDPRDRRRPA